MGTKKHVKKDDKKQKVEKKELDKSHDTTMNKKQTTDSIDKGNQPKKSLKQKIKEFVQKILRIFAVSFMFGILFAYLFLRFGQEVIRRVTLYTNNVKQKTQEISNEFAQKIDVFHLWHKDNQDIQEGTHNDVNEITPKSNSNNLLDKLQEYSATKGEYSPQNEPIVNVVKEVLPGVVSIAIDQSNIIPGPTFVNQETKIGSGFVVDSKKGIIVTNRHVVEEADKFSYKVVTSDGKTLQVINILQDPINDLAFVFVNPKNIQLHELKLGNSDVLQLGQTVIAIGTPFGEFPSTVTSGIISGLNRKVDAPDVWGYKKTYFNVIQTDAPINPGNSGGPLINLGGEVIGVNFAKINGGDNISFALPINLVKKRLAQYKEYGHFKQAFLGVSVKHIDYATATYYGIPAGDLVINVVPNSPADKAGIQPKDIIVQIDNYNVADLGLINILSKYDVGDKIQISILRPEQTEPGYGVKFKKLQVSAILQDRYDFINK